MSALQQQKQVNDLDVAYYKEQLVDTQKVLQDTIQQLDKAKQAYKQLETVKKQNALLQDSLKDLLH